MAFFKFRSRGPQANEGRNAGVAAAPAESVEAMRRRARHRLLGAAVLVLIGVIGFPLLFDTQPRPVSVDIPIEIPDRSKTKPLALPPTPAPATTPTPSTGASTAATAPSGSGMITESADGAEIPPSRPAPAAPPAETKPAAPVAETKPAAPVAEARPEPKPEPKPKPEPEAKPEARAEAKPEKPTPAKPADDGNRARALLEGKAAAAAAAKPAVAADENGRFVVQVGAFADADKAREVRQRLEKAGLKTYTSVAKTAGGERTRVRVGPFGTRAEADKAASRVKGLSLSASVLSL
ncbi:SPOR domain-containing protein [Variovorax sp. MHTC-1]|uniref:SPOR domain-containing protein n=1 Tax=Variovorax sp. MHTC-1 TaxID=2495593 RepID=UPI000F898447|nr:SPOR domain-containing protein [Variovorax sp. MHTC-1]RST51009.1 SPOR domain-containing protein [Variovorax sp. MHTC-1]